MEEHKENTEINKEPILHIRCNPMVFEILREKGKGFDRSPHQEAYRLILKKMHEDGLMPRKDLPTALAELLYGIIKIKFENDKRKT